MTRLIGTRWKSGDGRSRGVLIRRISCKERCTSYRFKMQFVTIPKLFVIYYEMCGEAHLFDQAAVANRSGERHSPQDSVLWELSPGQLDRSFFSLEDTLLSSSHSRSETSRTSYRTVCCGYSTSFIFVCRDVAQSGRALSSGDRGRGFKSHRRDQLSYLTALQHTI